MVGGGERGADANLISHNSYVLTHSQRQDIIDVVCEWSLTLFTSTEVTPHRAYILCLCEYLAVVGV